MKHHTDPSRPLRERDAAESAKREPREAPDGKAREQRMQYERELLRRNRSVEQLLDHALIESFPASDPLAVTPEGTFPVRDPRLAPDAPHAPDAPPEPGAPAAPERAHGERPADPGSPARRR